MDRYRQRNVGTENCNVNMNATNDEPHIIEIDIIKAANYIYDIN